MDKIQIAKEKKQSGQLNCAQAVACTYCAEAGVDEAVIASACSAFGGGMGCMEGTCGALVGAGVVLGMRFNGNRAAAMKSMRRIMTKFEARNGATICKELKGVATGHVLRACADCVADAAEFLEDELSTQLPSGAFFK